MILATAIRALSALKTRPVTRTFAPVSCPTLAAVAEVTVPLKPSSCSPSNFSNSARSTMMIWDSDERWAVSKVDNLAPMSFTDSSGEAKSKTATVVKAPCEEAQASNSEAVMSNMFFMLVLVVWQVRVFAVQRRFNQFDERKLSCGTLCKIGDGIVLSDYDQSAAFANTIPGRGGRGRALRRLNPDGRNTARGEFAQSCGEAGWHLVRISKGAGDNNAAGELLEFHALQIFVVNLVLDEQRFNHVTRVESADDLGTDQGLQFM